MKKQILFGLSFFTLLMTSISCSPDYIEQAQTVNTPTNPSGQSIILNFTSGNFIGVLGNEAFSNGMGTATRSYLFDDATYLLLYANMANQFNGHIFNKDSGQLTSFINNDTDINNIITIISNGKKYTSTSGTFSLTEEQVISNQNGMEIVKCKFVFNGTFDVSPTLSSELIETNVKINGTVIF